MTAFALITYGCQMNRHDSLRISEVLRRAGYVEVPTPGGADVVVVNTCSVRAKAEQKLRSELGRLGRLKRRRPALRICVAGCVAQQEGERLLRQAPHVDLVIGPDNIRELPALLWDQAHGAPPSVRTTFDLEMPHFLQAATPSSGLPPCAYVTIMKGCDQRCAFCVVPRTRGPERYRPSPEILQEVEQLVAAGVREITLLGQTVNSYHDPLHALPPAPGAGELPWRHTQRERALDDESEFPALLRAIAAAAPGLRRLRYTSPHPRHLTASLIRAHESLPLLARHLHLPVQSGSDCVLKRMVRRHTVAEYTERAARLRATVPSLTLSSDVIVGFPGETREDFAASLRLVRAMGYSGLFAFKYSRRPNTPAARLEDDVSDAEKSARLAELFELSDALRQAHLSSLVGSTQQVLVEGPGTDGGYTGRTERNEIAHFSCRDDPTGELVDVRITRPYKNSLAGEMADPRRASAPRLRSAESAHPTPGPDRRRSLPVV
jgi:tRNA-2-methylthio-N6-dimethylallyladenosine synthase